MKIPEIFINPLKKLTPAERGEFQSKINSENMKRLFWLNIIVALMTLAPVISIILFQSKGQWSDSPVYYYYLMLYISRIIFCLSITLISFIFLKNPNKMNRLSRTLIAWVFAGYFILDGCANSIMVQTLQGGITVYVIVVLVISTVLYYPIVFNSILLTAGYLILSFGILLIQPNTRLIIGDIINASFTTSVGWFISRMLFRSKVTDYINHLTIRKQAQELEYANSILQTNAEDHSSKLENTHNRLHDEVRKKISSEKRIKRYHDDLQEVFRVSFFFLKVPLQKVISYFNHLVENPEKIEPDKGSFIICLDEIRKAERSLLILLDNIGIYMNENPFSPVDLNYVLEQVIENNSFEIREKKLDIKLSKLPVIMGDKHQFFRLFQGFIEYSVCGENILPYPEIHFGYESSDGIIQFYVQTNKPISDIDAQGIFSIEHLLTMGEHGNSVNLTGCKRIIEHHGGEMWIESGKEPGVRIGFTLPKP
jgi:signal transduction histidine kinase